MQRTIEHWLSYIESVHFRSIDLQLDRIRVVLNRLLPAGPRYDVISVAGTNGKGSAVEMLSCVLAETGLRIGTYTSPHLVHYTERVRVDGKEAAEQELCAAFDRIEHARQEVPLTYFEFGTLAALLVFEVRGVDLAVMEVGLGGRLDAVNAVEPCASLITSVAIDHQHWLGYDREAIGTEKAGIFRAGRPAVCADPNPPEAILRDARQIHATLYQLGEHFSYNPHGAEWDWIGPENEFLNLPVPAMPGEHQLRNAAGVLMVLMALKHLVPVTEQQLRAGLSSVRMRGRFEVIPGAPAIILDVAHNEAAVARLKDNLDELLRLGQGSGRTLAVCGMLQDKPVAKIGAQLKDRVDAWYVGTIHDPRGHDALKLAELIRIATKKPVSAHESVPAAFDAAIADAGPTDRVLAFGSFHTVGDIIRVLEHKP